jgi:hypothetical protein
MPPGPPSVIVLGEQYNFFSNLINIYLVTYFLNLLYISIVKSDENFY